VIRSLKQFWAMAILLVPTSTGVVRGADPTPPHPSVSPQAVKALNAEPVAGRPTDAEAPGRLSVDHGRHAEPYNFQAPGIAVLPLPGGGTRIWLSWYQQNNNPGGGAIGGGSIPHVVYAYSDNPFDTADPVWHRVLYMEPVAALGGETASDPEVFALPDGRLLCSYITSGPDRMRKRSTYAFLIRNPAAASGAFELGRQQWLEYGVLSQPFRSGDRDVYAVFDEWNTARRFCRLEFPAEPKPDAIRAVRTTDIPWLRRPELTIFFESSVHPVSGDRFRAYRRTKEGIYTVLSEPGGRTWGEEQPWADHPSVNSRSAFARSPKSGRVLGAVNSPPAGGPYRTDLTLVVSEAEGAPGSFQQALNIEPDGGSRKIASQYPRLAFDDAGYVYCVYRWSDSRPGAPHHGAAIMVARVHEDRVAAGKAQLIDVEKRVAIAATPSEPAANRRHK
jgi:hypothetical protein